MHVLATDQSGFVSIFGQVYPTTQAAAVGWNHSTVSLLVHFPWPGRQAGCHANRFAPQKWTIIVVDVSMQLFLCRWTRKRNPIVCVCVCVQVVVCRRWSSARMNLHFTFFELTNPDWLSACVLFCAPSSTDTHTQTSSNLNEIETLYCVPETKSNDALNQAKHNEAMQGLIKSRESCLVETVCLLVGTPEFTKIKKD